MTSSSCHISLVGRLPTSQVSSPNGDNSSSDGGKGENRNIKTKETDNWFVISGKKLRLTTGLSSREKS